MDISFAAWHLINTIYKSSWNKLNTDKNNRTFYQCISSHFARDSTTVFKTLKLNPNSNLFRLNKSKLTQPINNKKSYAQASKINIEDVICIKDIFLTISSKKIAEINNIINKSSLIKSKIKMTIKRPLRKQIIVSMSKRNANIIGSGASFHINSINRHFKETNSNTLANFIYMKKFSIIIITNQAISVQDMNSIKKVLKEVENINQNLIKSSHLLQSKLYLVFPII